MGYTRKQVLTHHQKLQRMKPPFEGGCLCGDVRYRISELPFWSAKCFCRCCQMLGGGDAATAFTVRHTGFELLAGNTQPYEWIAESGRTVKRQRCKNCGTWVFSERPESDEWRSVLASTLDQPSDFVLISNVYVSEASSWADIDTNLLNFQKMPEDELPDMSDRRDR